jgi:hypothetical protein
MPKKSDPLNEGKRQLDLVTEYTSYTYDNVLKLYHAKARMYDDKNRRFMAQDIVVKFPQNSQFLNRYPFNDTNLLLGYDGSGVPSIDTPQDTSKEMEEDLIGFVKYQTANTPNMLYGNNPQKIGNSLVPDIYAIMQSSNLYVYCGNNPLRWSDPTGLSWEDTVYGIVKAIDDNNFGGLIGWAVKKLSGNGDRVNESEYDYYLGRVVGDAISVLIGLGSMGAGIMTILESIIAGGAITIGSGGTLVAGGVVISVAGVAAGTAMVTYGATVVTMAGGNFGKDYQKMQELGKTEYKRSVSGTGKEKASDVPSWARGNRPYKSENGKNFANRLMDEKYGKGNWQQNPDRMKEYSQIKKWGDRGFE